MKRRGSRPGSINGDRSYKSRLGGTEDRDRDRYRILGTGTTRTMHVRTVNHLNESPGSLAASNRYSKGTIRVKLRSASRLIRSRATGHPVLSLSLSLFLSHSCEGCVIRELNRCSAGLKNFRAAKFRQGGTSRVRCRRCSKGAVISTTTAAAAA